MRALVCKILVALGLVPRPAFAAPLSATIPNSTRWPTARSMSSVGGAAINGPSFRCPQIGRRSSNSPSCQNDAHAGPSPWIGWAALRSIRPCASSAGHTLTSGSGRARWSGAATADINHSDERRNEEAERVRNGAIQVIRRQFLYWSGRATWLCLLATRRCCLGALRRMSTEICYRHGCAAVICRNIAKSSFPFGTPSVQAFHPGPA